mgnify:CR=1 FL=1
MIKKIEEMSPAEVVGRIRDFQDKESEMYNQIQDIKKLFAELEIKFDAIKPQTFLEMAEYRNLKERFKELEDSGAVSDSEVKEFGELMKSEEKSQKEAAIECEILDKTARRLMRISVKIKNEIQIAQNNK